MCALWRNECMGLCRENVCISSYKLERYRSEKYSTLVSKSEFRWRRRRRQILKFRRWGRGHATQIEFSPFFNSNLISLLCMRQWNFFTRPCRPFWLEGGDCESLFRFRSLGGDDWADFIEARRRNLLSLPPLPTWLEAVGRKGGG